MLNKFIEKINESVKIVIVLLLIIAIFMTKSIFLLLFMTILTLIILILTNKSVKFYIETLKNSLSWLLFFSLMYIIIFRNIYLCLFFIYKLILIILILKSFIVNVNFNKLCNGIYTLTNLVKRKKINIEKISYSITMYIFLLINFFESKKEIKFLHLNKGKISYSIKNNLIPRLFISMKKNYSLEDSLKLKYFKAIKEKLNFSSAVALLLFITFFILVVFKEVIL